jgi:hypothetical protein
MTAGAADRPPAPDNALLDRALAETRRAKETVVATVAAIINGCLLLLEAVQLLYFLRLSRGYELIPPALVVVGIVLLVLASKLYAQRVWAAVTLGIVSAVAALGMVAWCLRLFLAGILPLLAEILPLALAIGAVMAGVAVGPCKRTAAARKQAAAAGIDIDL